VTNFRQYGLPLFGCSLYLKRLFQQHVIMPDGRMIVNDESGRIWKEEVVPTSRY
jgi:hypothetical protein